MRNPEITKKISTPKNPPSNRVDSVKCADFKRSNRW